MTRSVTREPIAGEVFLERQILKALETYTKPNERAALRCALADIAHMLDVEVIRIGQKNQRARHQAEALTRCANTIWAARDMIQAARTLDSGAKVGKRVISGDLVLAL